MHRKNEDVLEDTFENYKNDICYCSAKISQLL